MNKKRWVTFLLAAVVFTLPVMAVFDSPDLSLTLRNLRLQLEQEHQRISRRQARLTHEYEEQHQKMIDLIKECNELSLVLYSQRQNYTFDLAYALEKVTTQYNEFNRQRSPYDRIAANMDLEIDRYARLLESLRRLPPELDVIDVNVIPDSLMYHNDSLDKHVLQSGTSLSLELTAEALDRAASAPFILDSLGEQDRDSCILYTSELLKMCADRKALIVMDSTHYQEAYLRLKESYDYARERYEILQERIFVVGQTPWMKILENHSRYWKRMKEDLRDKYDFNVLAENSDNFESRDTTTNKVDNTIQFIMILVMVLTFLLVLAVFLVLVYLLCRFVPSLRKNVARQQKPFIALLGAILLFMLITTNDNQNIRDEALDLASTFLWLLGAIVTALLFRLKPHQLINSVRLYLPTVGMALGVIGCRVLFLPNSVMNFIFPPVLILFLLWQLVACLRCGKRAQESDRVISWISFGVTAVALGMSVLGFIFMALLLLVWWYFLLSAIHIINTVATLLTRYRENHLERRLKEYKAKHASVMTDDEGIFLFPVTWFYDLTRSVIIPILALGTLPFSLKLALDVFDFKDLYNNLYYKPFVNITDASGDSSLWLSFRLILICIGLFFVFRYLGQMLRSLHVFFRYRRFKRRHNRDKVRNNEINFSLANSLITVASWSVYVMTVFILLKIPTGWLAMIATGLSAGIGLAMKDILNNFIYGIQLMGGRLRVGDWIECDGVRGQVTKISYQSTQIETLDDALISFLNADLFSKNFANLTRNNSYEFLKIVVGVAYGTDVQKVRDVLVDAMQVMRTKDKYGREIVRPDKGIYVVFGDFGDSSVNIAVKQYILVAEHIAYVDRAKEVIYNALNQNGITIPFPQLDIHVDKEDS